MKQRYVTEEEVRAYNEKVNALGQDNVDLLIHIRNMRKVAGGAQ